MDPSSSSENRLAKGIERLWASAGEEYDITVLARKKGASSVDVHQCGQRLVQDDCLAAEPGATFSLKVVKPIESGDEENSINSADQLEAVGGGGGGLDEILKGEAVYMNMLADVLKEGQCSGAGEDQDETEDDLPLSYYMALAGPEIASPSTTLPAVEDQEAGPTLDVVSGLLPPLDHPRFLPQEEEDACSYNLAPCPFPVVTCADDLSAVAGDVITTPCLLEYGFCLIRRPFTVLLCWRCEEGIPLNCVKSHIRSSTLGKIMVRRNGVWCRRPNESSFHTPVPEAHIEDILTTNLIELGIIENKEELMTAAEDPTGNSWRRTALPSCFPDPSPPIPGLRIYHDVFQCPVPTCGYWVPTKSGSKGHRINCHKGDAEQYPVSEVSEHPIQSLYSDYASYFPVLAERTSTDTLPTPDSVALPRLSPAQLIQRQKQVMLDGLQPKAASRSAADYYRNLKDKRLQPYLESSGIEGWLSCWDDRAEVCYAKQDHLDLKRPSDTFVNLRRLSLLVFVENLHFLSQTHHSIQFMLTNSSLAFDIPPAKQSPRFIPLTRELTIQAYSSYETQMIWVLCQHALREPLSDSGHRTRWDVFKFTAEQRKLLNELHKILDSEVLDNTAGKAALRQAVEALYFPEDLSPGNTCVFDFPPIAYIITTILNQDGAYIHPHLMTPGIAKLSYSFRIHANWRIGRIHEAASAAEGCTSKLQVEDSAKPFIRKMLHSQGGSPYSSARFFMGVLSRIAFSVPREGSSWWKGDTLHTEEGEISLPHFRSQLSESILEVEAFYESRIFLGLGTLDEFIKIFGVQQLTDDLNNSDEGYGVSHENRPQHENAEFSHFMQMVMDRGCLGFANRGAQQNLAYDVEAMDGWLADIDLGLRMLYPLIHITQGPPGRGTEELTLQITNTEHGVKRNLIWDPILETGGFNYDYQKTSSRQGVLSNILRALPFRIFALLHLHMRIIRPMEATYALLSVEKSKRLTISAAYSTQVYISSGRLWKTDDLSASIGEWSKRTLGMTWNLRSFRQFSALFSRKELKFELTNSELESVDRCQDTLQAKVDKKQGERRRYMNGVVDLMRGHSPAVANAHYGREVADGGAAVSDRSQQREVIKEYHKALHLSTEYQPLDEKDRAQKEEYRNRFNKLVQAQGGNEDDTKKKKKKGKTSNKSKENKLSQAKQGERHGKLASVAQGQGLETKSKQEEMDALADGVAGMSIKTAEEVPANNSGPKQSNKSGPSGGKKSKQGAKSTGKQRKGKDHYEEELSESGEDTPHPFDDSPYVPQNAVPTPSGSEPVRRSGRPPKPRRRFGE